MIKLFNFLVLAALATPVLAPLVQTKSPATDPTAAAQSNSTPSIKDLFAGKIAPTTITLKSLNAERWVRRRWRTPPAGQRIPPPAAPA